MCNTLHRNMNDLSFHHIIPGELVMRRAIVLQNIDKCCVVFMKYEKKPIKLCSST